MTVFNDVDEWVIAKVSKGVLWTCKNCNVSFPLVLLVWRCLICGLTLLMAAAMVSLHPSIETVAFICGAVVFVETARKGIILLWNDSRKVWSKELYLRYAAMCVKKRAPLAVLRVCVLIYGIFMVGSAVYYRVWDPTADYVLFINFLAVLMLFTYVGGNVEACDPPLPDDGDYFAAPAPSAA